MAYRSFAAAAIGLVLAAGPACAQSAIGLQIGAPTRKEPLVDRRIYQLKFSCAPRGSLARSPQSRFLVRSGKSLSHVIVVADTPAQAGDNNTIRLPQDARALLPLFTVKNGVPNPDNRTACPHPIYVYGGSDLYLIGIANYSTKHEPGLILSLGYGLAGLIPPLWSMFRGNLSEAQSALLTNYSGTQDPLRRVLSALDDEENYGVTIKLSPGYHDVLTDFSKVGITVTYLRSVITDGAQEVRNAFRKQLDTAPEKIDAANLNSCVILANALLSLGFSPQEDIPFAVAYRALRSGLSADQTAQCLGRDYALRAAERTDVWSFGASTQRVSAKLARDTFPDPPPGLSDQPAFAAREREITFFTRDMSRLTRDESGTPNPRDQEALNREITARVTLDDQTVKRVFGGAASQLTGPEFIKAMIDNGYRRFGCFQATTLGTALDGGKTLLMAFKADNAHLTLPIKDVLIFKPIYNEALIERIVVYDQYDWINSVMSARKYRCNDVLVEKPQTEQVALRQAGARQAGTRYVSAAGRR